MVHKAKQTQTTLGAELRKHFPIFEVKENAPASRHLAYLDSAASSQKPAVVSDRLKRFYEREYANIHRGAYGLSAAATEFYESARIKVARFINAAQPSNIIFTKGTTESINLVANALCKHLKANDTVLLTLLEHHSNIVPWQLLSAKNGLKVVYADIGTDARLNIDDFKHKLESLKPKLVAFTGLANSFGTLTPFRELSELSRQAGALSLLDAAQLVAHQTFDVAALNCDFAAFSGHKLYGPTGIGVLYASGKALEIMEPFQGGGGMIQSVTTSGSTFAEAPQKFEAGTPPIAEALGLAAAIDFVSSIGLERIAAYEQDLFEKAFSLLSKQTGVHLYGPATNGGKQQSIIAFNVEGIHPHDFSTVADSFNVQVRAGHHCAMPALARLGIASSARASIGMYSTLDDFEALVEAIHHARKLFS